MKILPDFSSCICIMSSSGTSLDCKKYSNILFLHFGDSYHGCMITTTRSLGSMLIEISELLQDLANLFYLFFFFSKLNFSPPSLSLPGLRS